MHGTSAQKKAYQLASFLDGLSLCLFKKINGNSCFIQPSH